MVNLFSVLAFGSACFLFGLLVGAFGVLSDKRGEHNERKNIC